MKKLILITSIIILTGIILYGMYNFFIKRTPEKILNQAFAISLKNFDYSIDFFKEQWYPNGDGELLAVFKFKKLTPQNIDYIKAFNPRPLPIIDTEYYQMGPNKIPKPFINSDTGYYFYRTGRIADWEINEGIKQALDFYIFIIDTEKGMAVLYYQFI